MIYLKKFDSHASYEEKLNGGVVDFKIPNVSYCKDANDVHFNPYNLIEFYVGNITRTTPQTVKIYTGETTSIPIQVSDGNKWYSYLLPKDNGLYKIEGDSVKKVNVKADIITTSGYTIIPTSTVEASFKGSNTSNVTDMSYMFNGCSGLTSLDVSNFDTNNVTNMESMFSGCTSLNSLVLSGWNTSNVRDMSNMFEGCNSLISLDVSSFDTNNVTLMSYMFNGCIGLKSLDLSNFNTSNVTDMGYMFSGCTSLTSLDLSGWNTSNVRDMSNMFEGCSGLTSLDLSDWVISDATDTSGMFDGCSNSLSIRMKGCNQTTIDKITAVKPSGAKIVTV